MQYNEYLGSFKTCETQRSVAALFLIVKNWKQPRCLSMCEWLNKLWPIHTMECYPANKKKKKAINTQNNLDKSPENYA